MKNFAIVFATAIICVSCKKDTPKDYIIFSGNITNTTDDKIIVANNDNSLRDTIQVAENGDFSDTLRIEPGSFLITYGKIFFRSYLEPGYNLNTSFNTEDFRNSLTYKGEGAVINTYLQEKVKKENEVTGGYDNLYSLDEKAFKSKVGKVKEVLLDFLEKQDDISEAFKDKERRNIEYHRLSKLMGYETSHAYITKRPDFKVSDDFLPSMADFKFSNDDDYQFSSSYRHLVSDYLKTQADELAKSKGLPEDIAYLTVISKVSNQTIKNELVFDHAKYGISYTSDLEDYYKLFIKASSDQENNETITKSYEKLRTVSKGKPSPKFVDYENNDGTTTSLDDLKGKYVYIDVWATWCGPCKQEIPSLKDIEKSYHGKNIEFLSISIDKQSDHDKWKKMIVDEDLRGIQVLADHAWESQFVQDYLIMGIPRFILLDPQGNIITANAPRPSQDELLDLFNDLNI